MVIRNRSMSGHMRISGTLMVTVWGLSLGTGLDALAGSGEIIFRNSPASSVIDGRTGLPVGPGQVVAGLYVSTNLDAGLGDPFELVAITPVAPSSDLLFWGIYSVGDPVSIPGTVPGQPILVQVKAWPVGFASWEDAFANNAEPLGASKQIGPVTLGGGISPIPSCSGSRTAGWIPARRPSTSESFPITPEGAWTLAIPPPAK
jgi:hypothetical protein